MKERFPSEAAERFQIRMPDGLRDRIRSAAESNARSMNSEIVHRLEQSFATEGGMQIIVEGDFPADQKIDEASLARSIEMMSRQIDDLQRHLRAYREFSEVTDAD